MFARKLAALTLGACAVAGFVNAPASQAATGDPVAFTGEVDTRIPLDRAQFTLRADLPTDPAAAVADGAEVPMLKLPTTGISTSGNSFTVAVNPADVPDRYVGPNGLVSLELQIYDPQSDSYAWTTQSVRLVGQGSAATSLVSARRWADPLRSGPARAGRSVVASQAPNVEVHAVKAAKRTKSVFAPRTDTCRTTKVGQTDAWATIGEAYPAAPGYGKTRGKAWMVHNNGSEITYGAAISTNGKTWSASGSRSVANTKGFAFEWDADTNPTISYQSEIRYYKYQYDCGGVIINRTVQAALETGGVRTIHRNSNPPNWLSRAKCIFNMPAGTWTKTTGKAYTNEGGVKIDSVIGIELSTKRAYTSGSNLNYKMDAGHDSLCGNTDKPNPASKVQQFYNRIEEEL